MKKSLILVLLFLAGAVSMTAQDVQVDHPTVMKVTGKVVNVGKITSTGAIDLQKTAGSEGKIVNQGQGSEIYTNGLIVGAGTLVENEGLLCVDCEPGSTSGTAELAFSSDANLSKEGTLKFMTYNLGAEPLSIKEQLLYASPSTVGATYGDSLAALSFQKVYGSLYQWGRKADGHEKVWSTVSTAPGVDPLTLDANGQVQSGAAEYRQFIKEGGSTTNYDWIIESTGGPGYSNANYHMFPGRWDGGVNTSFYTQPATVPAVPAITKTAADPCPTGFRVPTQVEWESIVNGIGGGAGSGNFNGVNKWVWVDAGIQLNTLRGFGGELSGQTTGSAGFLVYPSLKGIGETPTQDSDYSETPGLFLPAAGNRYFGHGLLGGGGIYGYYWSSTAYSYTGFSYGYNLYFGGGVVIPADKHGRAYGFSVRCVAD